MKWSMRYAVSETVIRDDLFIYCIIFINSSILLPNNYLKIHGNVDLLQDYTEYK